MLNDIKGTLLSITRNVGKTSSVLVKTTKLSVTLAQEQEALKALYVEIGKKVHEIYQYGGTLGKFFDEKYREIEGLERKIDGLKEEIAKIKGVKECPKCGKQVDKNAEFCPKCGLRLEGVAPMGEEHDYPPGAGPYASAPSSASFAAPSPEPYASAPPPGPYAAAPPSSEPIAVPPPPSGPYAPPPSSSESFDAPPIPAIPAEAAAPSIVAAPPKTITCKVCGSQNDASTKFCLSCGRLL
jgi:hypothetical protein